MVHTQRHIDNVFKPEITEGYIRIDNDTIRSSGTSKAVRRAAGSSIVAVDNVINGIARSAFCAVRPPGHHAEIERSMGFCFINNVAVGAMYAHKHYGMERIAIIDFDVHHGNGTQQIFWDKEEILFASSHQYPLFPGTGSSEEKGINNNIINIPLSRGADSDTFRQSYEKYIFPAVDAFSPEIIFISAGFDAHVDDPLSQMQLNEDDFFWITQEIRKIAELHCDGKIVSMLEGGYNYKALCTSVRAHISALI